MLHYVAQDATSLQKKGPLTHLQNDGLANHLQYPHDKVIIYWIYIFITNLFDTPVTYQLYFIIMEFITMHVFNEQQDV